MSDVVAFLKEMTAFILVLGGLVTIIYSGVSTLIKARAESAATLKTKQIEEKKTESDSRARDVELAEKLNAIQEKVLASVESRFTRLEAQLADAEQTLAQTRSELASWKYKYTKLSDKRTREHEITMKLLDAIQTGLEARESTLRTSFCMACSNQDQTMIDHLQEIRKLFKEE